VITCHGGASAGHHTFIGFNRDYGTGVVVLDNVARTEHLATEAAKKILEAARRY